MENVMDYDINIKNLHDVINSGGVILSTNLRHTAIERLADRYAANVGGEPRDQEQVAMYIEDLDSRSDEVLIQEYIFNGLL